MTNLANPSENPRAAAAHYLESINRAIDHIVQHLDQPLSLEPLAEIAGFSAFHFHRIFRTVQGETLNQFIKRLRLERALWMLSHRKSRSLTQIAMACGFASSSDFSRCFKERYGVPPSAFDLQMFRDSRREEMERATCGGEFDQHVKAWPEHANEDNFEIVLKRYPPRCVAYLRVLEPYRHGAVTSASAELLAWATARGVEDGQWLGYMWDDPEIVAMKDCRYDVGVVAPEVEPEGAVGRFEFPAMTVASLAVRGSIHLEMRAIDYIYRTWLPASGYVPADLPGFEAWIGKPFAHGLEYFELFVEIPIE